MVPLPCCASWQVRCLDADGETFTAADGTHVCVLVDSESGKAVPLAAPFKRAMAEIDENPVKASL